MSSDRTNPRPVQNGSRSYFPVFCGARGSAPPTPRGLRLARMAPKWAALRQMSDEEVVALYDQLAKSTGFGLDFCRNEMIRRAFERSSAASHELAAAALEEARASRRLARWNMVVAVVAVVAAIVVPLLAG